MIAPSSATISTSDAISNGTAHVVNSSLPICSIEMTLISSVSPGHSVLTTDRIEIPRKMPRSERRERPLRPVQGSRQVSDAREHHREQHEDRDRAAVDEHLHDRQELCRQQDEYPGNGQQREDEEQR